MLTQPIESSFSRVANGNFSNYLAFWEGNATRVEAARSNVVKVGEPRTYAKFTGPFKHLIQYSDLAVYPSVVDFGGPQARAYPVSMTDLVVGSFSGALTPGSPFAYYDFRLGAGSLVRVPAGSPLVLDAVDPAEGMSAHSGEYRVSRVLTDATALVHPVKVPMPFIVRSGDGVSASYNTVVDMSDPNNPVVILTLRVVGDVMDIARPDGTKGVKVGDYFVSADLKCTGTIAGIAGNLFTIYIDSSMGDPPLVPAPNWGTVRSWAVGVSMKIIMARQAPCCLYDLTLVYTIDQAGPPFTILPAQNRIKVLDEMGNELSFITPMKIDDPYVFRIVPLGNGWYRYIQRFQLEHAVPLGNRYEIYFSQGTAAETCIADVALYRGNFTDKFLVNDTGSSEVLSLLETPVSVESEIVPRGTIIAYTGGAACPPGYVPVLGAGEEAHNLSESGTLFDNLGELKNIFDVTYTYPPQPNPGLHGLSTIFPASSDEPRTLVALKNIHRDTGKPPFPFQKWGRFVPVTGYRYVAPHPVSPPCLSSQLWRDQHALVRASIGDPDPIWADGTFVRADVLPGYVLEIRYPTRSFFMIITQYAEGNLPYAANENEPRYPFGWKFNGSQGCTDVVLWWANAQVEKGAPRNDTFSTYGIYGSFTVLRRPEVQMEILGAWQDLLRRAWNDSVAGTSVEAIVWKTGVVAHGQRVPESSESGVGGYSYVGESHSHRLATTDAPATRDVGQSGQGAQEIQLPTEHTHGWMFGAVTLPRIRPVLLCQRI